MIIIQRYDLIIAGGGLTGVAAGTAVALAKNSGSDVQCIDIVQLRNNLKNNGAIIEI